MPNNCDFAEVLRTAIQKQLPKNAFLKFDRRDGLFITNTVFTSVTVTPISGFETTIRGNLTVIYPTAEHILAFENEYDRPIGDLSRSVYQYRCHAAVKTVVSLFSEGVKLIRTGTPSSITAYDKRVRQHIAVALREEMYGGIYAIAILADYLNTFDKE